MAQLTTASVGVATPYQNWQQEIIDASLWQVWYRTFGIVGTHMGVADAHAAAVWLSANGRGGRVSWVVPGRAFRWTGIQVIPGEPDSPTMNAVFAGSALAQLSTAISRYGYWVQRFLSGRTGQ